MSAAPSPEWGDAVTLGDAFSAVRRVWGRALVGGALVMLMGIGVGLVRPKSYVARASFVAEQTKLPSLSSGLGALAAQFGIDMASEAGRSPHFYRELLTTSGLLGSLLDSLVPVGAVDSLRIRELLLGTSDTSRRNTDRALRRLRKRINAAADVRTSVVTFGVRAKTPATAERIADLLIGATKHFNVTIRQLQAKERRQFLEGRKSDAYGVLRASEEDLRRFYERNRRFAESPTLVFEESRMKRIVDLQQELYTSLSKELETARIQEVNDTPTITVVDRPLASTRPSGPGILMVAAGFFALGASATGAVLLLLGGLRRSETVRRAASSP